MSRWQIDPQLAGCRTALPAGLPHRDRRPLRGKRPGAGIDQRRHADDAGGGAGLLMIQLQSFSRTFMVLLTAPLG
jgi:hypothetical protein